MRLAPARDRSGPSPVPPHHPRQGNWIWLASGIMAMAMLAAAALRLTSGGCPAAGRPAAAPGAATPAAGHSAGAPPGRPAGPATGHRAVFYDPGHAAGSCALGPFPAGGWYASLPPGGYADGLACGSYLAVRGPAGQVRAEVVDSCGTCARGTVDLSRAAFTRIADPQSGTAAVTYRPVTDPPLPGPLMFRLDTAVPGRLAIQVRNHGNRLALVEIYQAWGGHWQPLVPDADGYWSGPLATRRHRPAGRIRLRITDTAGHRVVVNGVPLSATMVRSATWMYRSAQPAAGQPGAGRSAGTRATTAPRSTAPGTGCQPSGWSG